MDMGVRRVIRRVWYAIRRRRFEADLVEELEQHRDLAARDLERYGFDRDTAGVEARRQFGSTLLARDQARDVWIGPWLEGIGADVRFAARLLLKDRAFAATAMLTLALGIGANATIFSAVDALLVKPLPFADADGLVAIWKGNPTRGWIRNPVSTAELVAWQAQGRVFDDVAAFTGRSCVVSGGNVAEEDPCEIVSSRLFPLLGVAPLAGRVMSADEDDPDKPRVVVLSYGLWQRRFGGDPAAIGGSMTINGTSYTIVGVMPAGLSHAYSTPYRPLPAMWLSGIGFTPVHTWNDYLGIARLKPHVTPRQAEAILEPVSIGLDTAYPELKGWRPELRTLREMNAGDVQSALLVLLGAVLFVLLIACANVANLLLARGTGRRHELVLRAALGAGRWRVIRQLLTESLLIALIGGMLGLIVAWWGAQALVTLAPEALVRAAPGLDTHPLDLRVLAFVLVATLLTTLFFGVAPARQGATLDLGDALKETSRGTLHPRASRLRSGLVFAQIALAMVLLVGAGLMIRTLSEMRGAPLGLDPTDVLTLRVPLAGDRYKDPAAVAAFWRNLVASVRTLPGVESASAARGVPLHGWAGQFFTTSDQPNPPAGEVPDANYVVTGPDYFKTLRIPLRAGRVFDARDTQSATHVAIVNEDLVRLYWPGQDPLGRRIRMGSPDAHSSWPWMTVIGVVGTVSQGFDAGFHAGIYVPDQQYPWLLWPQHLIVRTVAGVLPASVINDVVREIHRLDKNQPAADIRTLDELAGEQMAQQRMVTALLGAFATLALVLAALGIYGVLSYAVARRAREIGVRVALGARPSSVLRLVIGDGGRLAAIGIAAGIGAALLLTRLLTDLLFGVRPTDALTFVTGALVLALASLLACYIPARRAMRIDPIDVLRRE